MARVDRRQGRAGDRVGGKLRRFLPGPGRGRAGRGLYRERDYGVGFAYVMSGAWRDAPVWVWVAGQRCG
mgnify:CR=1 FL=1